MRGLIGEEQCGTCDSMGARMWAAAQISSWAPGARPAHPERGGRLCAKIAQSLLGDEGRGDGRQAFTANPSKVLFPSRSGGTSRPATGG